MLTSCTPISLVLKIGPDGAEDLGGISQKTKFTETITPHVSLIQGKATDGDLHEFVKWIEYNYSSLPKTLSFEQSLNVDSPFGIYLDVLKNSSDYELLSSLNKRLVETVGTMQELDSVLYRINNNLPHDIRLIEKYGRDFYVPENFSPHITLFYGYHKVTFLKQLERSVFSISDVSLYEIDFYGNPTASLYNLPLA